MLPLFDQILQFRRGEEVSRAEKVGQNASGIQQYEGKKRFTFSFISFVFMASTVTALGRRGCHFLYECSGRIFVQCDGVHRGCL